MGNSDSEKIRDDQNFLREIEARLEKNYFQGDQIHIFDELIEKAKEYISVSEIEIRAFFVEAIKKWENKKKSKFGGIRLISPSERIQSLTEVFRLFEDDFMILISNDKQKVQFKLGLEEVLKIYREKYSTRSVSETGG